MCDTLNFVNVIISCRTAHFKLTICLLFPFFRCLWILKKYAGIFCPFFRRFAGFLLGITNTFATIPGVVAPIVTGYFTEDVSLKMTDLIAGDT